MPCTNERVWIPCLARLLLILSVLRPHSAQGQECEGSSTLEVSAGERETLVAVVIASQENPPKTTSSLILDSLASAVQASTSLRVVSPEQIGLNTRSFRACPSEGRLGCWINSIPYGLEPRPRYLLALALYPKSETSDLALGMLFDLNRVAPASSEAEIFELAASAPPVTIDAATEQDLESIARDWFARPFRALVEANGHGRPPGRVFVESDLARYSLRLDGALLGRTEGRCARVIDAAPGSRTFELEWSAGRSSTGTVNIEPEAETRVSIAAPGRTNPWRTFTVGVGIGVAAAGVALTSVALVRGARGPRIGCLSSDPGLCSDPTWVNTGWVREPGISTDPSTALESGVPLAPVGVGLLVAGAAWSLGALWVGDEQRLPWPSWLGGLVLGAVTTGVMIAAGG